MARQKIASKEVDTSTAKPMYKVTAESIQGLEPIITAEAEYERLYGWIHKGDVDATLKAILKEIVRIRLGGGHV